MSSNRLQEEIRRQEQYLADLPPTYEFPLFNSKTALESQRSSAYQNTAAAAREIVDNAIEAQASSVHVVQNQDLESAARAVGRRL